MKFYELMTTIKLYGKILQFSMRKNSTCSKESDHQMYGIALPNVISNNTWWSTKADTIETPSTPIKLGFRWRNCTRWTECSIEALRTVLLAEQLGHKMQYVVLGERQSQGNARMEYIWILDRNVEQTNKLTVPGLKQ